MTAPEHSNLPLRDYDHLPLAALGHRIRSLTAGELGMLLSYEREHANRPAAIQIFEARRAELEAGAEPSGGGPQDGPEWPSPPAGGSPGRPETTGPPAFPPPHGRPRPAGPPEGRPAALGRNTP